jgi:serine/threonine protein kinase
MPVDARTDVFSTGIILHEMLTTEKLFRGDTEFALMEKVRKAEVAPPSKFNRRVPAELDRIVLKALARDLPDRYQTARELADDLEAFLTQYRLAPSEMQEFMRNLFRQDYQQEAQELAACRAAGHDSEPHMIIEAPMVLSEEPAVEMALPAPTASDPEPEPPRSPPRAGGLWSRLKDKFSK